MAPSRAKHESSSVAGPSRRPYRHQNPYTKKIRPNDEDALPGVQRLKASLRQTKRLLAKDNLAADVRVETERRLKALEADLARAEQSRKERHYATKYHRVKFFERQKIVRKISQTKRSIATSKGKEEEELESTLADLRVDLNYVLHFPKTEKYVSLFPPEVRKSGSITVAPAVASSGDNERRSKVREMIRERMRCGELSTEPENKQGKTDQEDTRLTSRRRGSDTIPLSKPHSDSDVAHDDFFGDDDEESEASDP